MMNLFELAKTFVTIVDSGSIHVAAKKMHQTDAAISKKLSKLEQHLDLQLVNRERKGLLLTESGQRYYHEVKIALAQFENATKSVTKEEPQGQLVVAGNFYYLKKHIIPTLPQFLKQYPKLSIKFEVAEMWPDFNNKKIDILFGVSAEGDDNLVRKQIGQTHYVICGTKQYLKQYGIPKTSAELLQHRYISHSARPASDIIQLNNETVHLKTDYLANNVAMMVELALKNIGLIWTHANILETYLESKKLIPVLEKQTNKIIPVYLYFKYQPYTDPKIRAFIDFFV